jgi:hypothetical protein
MSIGKRDPLAILLLFFYRFKMSRNPFPGLKKLGILDPGSSAIVLKAFFVLIFKCLFMQVW